MDPSSKHSLTLSVWGGELLIVLPGAMSEQNSPWPLQTMETQVRAWELEQNSAENPFIMNYSNVFHG